MKPHLPPACQPGSLVGVDMEWRAGFGCVAPQRVALIQLATPGHVFLLDLCAADFSCHLCMVQAIRQLFADPSILKLGEPDPPTVKNLWPVCPPCDLGLFSIYGLRLLT